MHCGVLKGAGVQREGVPKAAWGSFGECWGALDSLKGSLNQGCSGRQAGRKADRQTVT